jgi:hypothetical protein
MPCGRWVLHLKLEPKQLRPVIGLAHGADPGVAAAIHQRIHAVCFIARSVNFPVTYVPVFESDA